MLVVEWSLVLITALALLLRSLLGLCATTNLLCVIGGCVFAQAQSCLAPTRETSIRSRLGPRRSPLGGLARPQQRPADELVTGAVADVLKEDQVDQRAARMARRGSVDMAAAAAGER